MDYIAATFFLTCVQVAIGLLMLGIAVVTYLAAMRKKTAQADHLQKDGPSSSTTS